MAILVLEVVGPDNEQAMLFDDIVALAERSELDYEGELHGTRSRVVGRIIMRRIALGISGPLWIMTRLRYKVQSPRRTP